MTQPTAAATIQIRVKRPPASWSAPAEATLIEHLVDAAKRGQMSDNNFKSSVYTAASTKLIQGGHDLNATQIRSRWTRFKAEFKVVKALREASGFGWDDARKTVTAADTVWDRYIEGHPGAKPFRRKSFPHYDDICSLIDDTTATGVLAMSSVMTPVAKTEAQASDSAQPGSEDEHEPEEQSPHRDQASPPPSMQPRPARWTAAKVDSSPISISSSSSPPKPTKKRAAERDPFTTPSRPAKRQRPSTNAALSLLAGSVDSLVTGLLSDNTNTPTTRGKGRTCTTDENTPVKRAWTVVCKEEARLSPTSIALARRALRRDHVAEDYLSFDVEEPNMREARTIFFQSAMDGVQNQSAPRPSM